MSVPVAVRRVANCYTPFTLLYLLYFTAVAAAAAAANGGSIRQGGSDGGAIAPRKTGKIFLNVKGSPYSGADPGSWQSACR